MRSPEMGKGAPEQKTPEAKQEVKWVYAMSVPNEKGEPSIEIIIGVPQEHSTTGWLLPTGFEEKNLNYQIEVPLNVVIGGQKIECVAKGTVMGDLGGNKFSLHGIEAKQNLPEGAADAIAKAYERVLDPAKNRTVRDALNQEIEAQCRNYFKEQRVKKAA